MRGSFRIVLTNPQARVPNRVNEPAKSLLWTTLEYEHGAKGEQRAASPGGHALFGPFALRAIAVFLCGYTAQAGVV
jgi:hypothetical protein